MKDKYFLFFEVKKRLQYSFFFFNNWCKLSFRDISVNWKLKSTFQHQLTYKFLIKEYVRVKL